MHNRIPSVVGPGEGRRITVLGQEILIRLSCAKTGGDYYIFENVVPPGARVPRHIHTREDEIIQVLEGELEVFLDGKTFVARAGAIAFFPRDFVHGFANVGERPAKGSFLVSLGENLEKYFDELSDLTTHEQTENVKCGS